MAATDPIIIPLVIDGKQVTPTLREMENELKKLNKELKDLPVGTDEFNKKSQQLDQTRQRFDEVRNSTAGARVEGTKLLDSIRQLGPGGQLIGNVADNFRGVREQGAQAAGGVSTFGRALVAIPILAVVAAIAALIQYFSKTDEGATKLEGIMGGLRAAFGLIQKPLVDFGKFLFDAFENPKKAGEQFLQFLQDQFVSRVTSLLTLGEAIYKVFTGDFAGGAKSATDALGQFVLGVNNITDKASEMGAEMKKAAQDAYALALAMDDLSDRERAFSTTAKEAENQISRLLLQAKNRGLEDEKRLELLDQASAIETRLHAQQVAFAQENLLLVQRENALKKAAGEDTDEMAQKEVDAQLRILELDGKSIELKEKIANRRSALTEAIQADHDKELAMQEKAYNDELKLNEDFENALLKQEQDAKNVRLDLITTEEEEAKLAIEQQFFGQIEAKKQQEEALYQVEKAAKERRLKEIQGDGLKERADRAKLQSDILKGESERAGREIELEQRTNKLKDTLRQTNLAMASSALQLGIQFLSRDEESRKKYGVAIKGLAIADIAVNLSKELSSIAAAAAANPANALTFGAAGATQGTILSGIAIGRAALQTATVLGTQYSLGGISKGSRHGSAYGVAGIAMIDRVSGLEVGEMEGNEAILTSGVVNNPTLLQAASRINVLGGGRAFAAEGAILGGAPTSLDLADPSSNALIQEFRTMSAKIDTWQRELKVTNNITSLYKKQAEYEKMVETTNI